MYAFQWNTIQTIIKIHLFTRVFCSPSFKYVSLRNFSSLLANPTMWGREGVIERHQKFDFFSYDDTPNNFVKYLVRLPKLHFLFHYSYSSCYINIEQKATWVRCIELAEARQVQSFEWEKISQQNYSFLWVYIYSCKSCSSIANVERSGWLDHTVF